MSIPSFTEGYPPDGSSLGQTKAVIRDNLDGTFLTLAVDHVNNNGQPGSQPAGYHTIIHEVPQSNVSTVTGYTQVFSGVPGTLVVNSVTTPLFPNDGDTQLYALSSNGNLAQLSGYSAATFGFTWIGGMLMQWGLQPLTSAANQMDSVTFGTNTKRFPNNCYSVQATLICQVGGTTSSDNTLSIVSGSVSRTGFSYQYAGIGGNRYTGFYWIAIGN